jgi:hypothetical protein
MQLIIQGDYGIQVLDDGEPWWPWVRESVPDSEIPKCLSQIEYLLLLHVKMKFGREPDDAYLIGLRRMARERLWEKVPNDMTKDGGYFLRVPKKRGLFAKLLGRA